MEQYRSRYVGGRIGVCEDTDRFTMKSEQRMLGNGAFIRRPSNVGSKVTNRLCGAFGAEDGR